MSSLFLLYLETITVIVINHIVTFSAGLFRVKKVLVESRRGHFSFKDGLHFTLNSNLRWFRHQAALLWYYCHTVGSSPRKIKREPNKQFYGATCRGQACGDGPRDKRRKASRNIIENNVDRSSSGKFSKKVKNADDILADDRVNIACDTQVGNHFGNEPIAIDEDDDGENNSDYNRDDLDAYSPLNVIAFDLTFDDDLVDLDDANLAMKIEVAKWRKSNSNSNVRGAGTSEATYYAQKAKKSLLAESAARNSQPISSFYTSRPPLTDDDYIANCLKDPVLHAAAVPKYTVAEALDKLLRGSAVITKNLNKNKKLIKVTHWNYIVSLSICRFFELIR